MQSPRGIRAGTFFDVAAARFSAFFTNVEEMYKNHLAFSTDYLTNIFGGGIIFYIKDEKMKRFLKNVWIKIKQHWQGILCLLLLGAIVFWRKPLCPIKYITGVACPGCGMTRAIQAALQLDFAAAFYYHPLWILLPVVGVLYLLLRYKKANCYINLLLAVSGVLLLSVYLYRLLLLPQGVVVWNPEKGLVARLIEFIRISFFSE
jgi:hypothetical protein